MADFAAGLTKFFATKRTGSDAAAQTINIRERPGRVRA
jgi:hypothetical protein